MLLNEHNSPYFLYSPYRLQWSIFQLDICNQLNCLYSLQSFVSFFLFFLFAQLAVTKMCLVLFEVQKYKNNIYLYFPHRNEWVTHFWHPGFVFPHDRTHTDDLFLTVVVSCPAIKSQEYRYVPIIYAWFIYLAGEHSGVTRGGKHTREASRPHLCYDG